MKEDLLRVLYSSCRKYLTCLAGSLDSGKRNGDGWFAVTEADPQNAHKSQLEEDNYNLRTLHIS